MVGSVTVTPLKLPIIDFSIEKMKPAGSSSSWNLVRNDVRRALEEYGCFEAIYDKVTLELHDSIFGDIKDLFNLPTETKRSFSPNKWPFDGYLGGLLHCPLYQTMSIQSALDFETIQSFTNLMWPDGNASFCKKLHCYSKRISELDKMVQRMVFESFGVEKYFNSHCESTIFRVRFIKYDAPNTSESTVGGTAHTDKNLVTILHQNQVNGLEIQRKDGEWIRSTPSASSFVVIIGESFYALFNGRLHCPLHRVMMTGNEARYSVVLFSSLEDKIQCPEELVDEQHPLLFKPFDEVGLLHFFRETGLKSDLTIEAYCAAST